MRGTEYSTTLYLKFKRHVRKKHGGPRGGYFIPHVVNRRNKGEKTLKNCLRHVIFIRAAKRLAQICEDTTSTVKETSASSARGGGIQYIFLRPAAADRNCKFSQQLYPRHLYRAECSETSLVLPLLSHYNESVILQQNQNKAGADCWENSVVTSGKTIDFRLPIH